MNDSSQNIPLEIMSLISMSGDESREITFFSEVIGFAERINLTDAQVYNAIGMNRSLWYRMRDNPDARTKKSNVLKLAIVLRLSFWEAFYLIALAGYSFVPGIDKTDETIARCLMSEEYAPDKIDEMLDENGCDTLFAEE